MQLKELSRRSGISAASIKYYLREDLLPAGESMHPTLAGYSDGHLSRLELITVLRKVVGLSIGQIKTLVSAIDDPEVDFLDLLGRTQSLVLGYDLSETREHPLTSAVVNAKDWPDVTSDARNALNAHLAQMEELGITVSRDVVEGYADAVDRVAQQDVGFVTEGGSRDSAVLTVAVGVHQYSKLLARMLALAQTSVSIRKYQP
ncbi:MerR family transcriptional regulator [Arthrobacter sp. H14]|uniref:MerR family transcriptional regulator n=1 Tax=Arthrobacter sp. H14 TaxID=1312959 RepID=UPI00047DBDF8|nr:MerR family transcriptional regulator [Arthrobacter sp. H14]